MNDKCMVNSQGSIHPPGVQLRQLYDRESKRYLLPTKVRVWYGKLHITNGPSRALIIVYASTLRHGLDSITLIPGLYITII